MTFAIVLGNADQIIQVSDRRLTWKGELVDDASNKAGHILCDDASLLYCFTGLARVGDTHETSRWLRETIQDISHNTSTFRNIIKTFAFEAEKYFSSSREILALPASSRRLTVMFSGYSIDQFLVTALVSNFQDFTNFIDHSQAFRKFTIFAERSNMPTFNNPTLVQAIGQFNAMNSRDENQVREMLQSRVPAEALRLKAINLVQDIAMRHKSGGTVGCKLNTACIDFINPQIPHSGYVTDEVESEISLIDQVDARSIGSGLLISDAKITATTPISFPKVHRNAFCPCGSGKKFRFCHRQ
jgi:hypothetical protein